MIKRRIYWLMMNGLMVASGIYGLFYGLEWAKNIFLFLTWATVVLSILCACCKETRLAARAKGRSIPAWLSVGVDIAIAIALASVGRFVLAAAVLIQISFDTAIMDGKD